MMKQKDKGSACSKTELRLGFNDPFKYGTWQAGRCQEGILGFGCMEFPEVVHQLGDETTAVSFQLLLRFSPLIHSF